MLPMKHVLSWKAFQRYVFEFLYAVFLVWIEQMYSISGTSLFFKIIENVALKNQ